MLRLLNRLAITLVAAGTMAAAVSGTSADTIVRRDGTRFEGTVATVDAAFVVLQTPSGTLRIARGEVLSIAFETVLPMKVEIRNVKSDDALDVLVDGDLVIRDARDGGEWVDITSRLKDGNTPIRLRIHNDRGAWAYRIHVRLNGQVVPLACGTPQATGQGCTCCGKTGTEHGTIDDLPEIWIHVDRAQGRAEILP
jgi:hypothetical protein